jgi:AmmeMemoRadiSam system protein A
MTRDVETHLPALSSADRDLLLRVARVSIQQALGGDDSLGTLLERERPGPLLHEPHGLFVTLKTTEGANKRLRGCVGLLSTEEPLIRTAASVARSSALEDPRFPPLQAHELPQVHISLSVLGRFVPLDNPWDIVVGHDGVELIRGERRAVFLPQVAVEQKWSTESLLEQLALKAGLERQQWRDAELRVFRTLCFAESDAG